MSQKVIQVTPMLEPLGAKPPHHNLLPPATLR